MTSLTRRRFLVLGGAGTAVGLAGVAGWTTLGPDERKTSASDSSPTLRRRTLVVVELGGGNDGLGTVVPDDGRYRDARPTLAVPEADLVRLAGLSGAALHPALAPLVPLWNAGKLAVVRSVGFEHLGRSHFECSQHWWDGALPGESRPDGWLGRWLAATAPPGGADPWRAVALGAGAQALRSASAFSILVRDPSSFGLTTPARVDAAKVAAALGAAAAINDPGTSAVHAASKAAVSSALRSVEHLGAALDAAETVGAETDGDSGRLTAGLGLAADLIVRRLGIEVITTGVGGFDTHADQAATHATLLGDLATGLASFWKTVTDAGLADDVLVMTTSEFGRRVAENGSGGTDHGLGGCQFLLGGGVHQGVVGTADLAHLVDGDLGATIDPRSMYAEALEWLGGPTDEVLGSYEDLGLVS